MTRAAISVDFGIAWLLQLILFISQIRCSTRILHYATVRLNFRYFRLSKFRLTVNYVTVISKEKNKSSFTFCSCIRVVFILGTRIHSEIGLSTRFPGNIFHLSFVYTSCSNLLIWYLLKFQNCNQYCVNTGINFHRVQSLVLTI